MTFFPQCSGHTVCPTDECLKFQKLFSRFEVSSFSGIATDSFVAVHIENYFQKPCVGKVNEVTDKQVLMQWCL